MSDLAFCFSDKVTDISSTLPPGYYVGMRRYESGREYTYMQADDTVAVNSPVKLDIAASATAQKVTPTAAAGDGFFGVAETAITDEYYGWITTRGVASCLVLDGVAIDDPLAPGNGALDTAVEAGSGDYEFVVAIALVANSSGSTAARSVYIR